MSFEQRDLLPAGTKLHNQRYCINATLGRGGFGITYRAIDTTWDRAVVIKEFFPQEQATRKSGKVVVPRAQQLSYKKALHRYFEEARMLYDINQKNVVRVFDYFESRNTAYIVMELIQGLNLRELLDQQPKRCFPPSEVEKIIDQMVIALDTIHCHGVFHLDLSPDNVLQTSEGKIVLIDFGAARQFLKTDKNYSSSRPYQYKLAYAPLELLNATDVGPRSDLFELAMMAYELLSGQPPPSALLRAGPEEMWQPKLADERWQKVLLEALHLKQDLRPAGVREWWTLYHQQGIIFGPRTKDKSIIIGPHQTDNNLPDKQGIILGARTERKGIVFDPRQSAGHGTNRLNKKR